MPDANASSAKVFVTDYDGTLTAHDFYQLIQSEVLPPETPNYWQQFLDDRLSHFEVLERIFAAIRADEATLLDIARRCQLDPHLPARVAELRQAGWQVVVCSAGCGWYIERMLAEAGVDLPVYANPGRFSPQTGLTMRRPIDSPFYSQQTGIDKGALVRWYLHRGARVAFAGDGRAYYPAAIQVPASRRFARGTLAQMLTRAGEPFQTFATWSAAAEQLLATDRP